MTLNHECIRGILLQLEEKCSVRENHGTFEWGCVSISELCEKLPDYQSEEIFYSLYNLEQAGFIDVTKQYADGGIFFYLVNYITFAGHEYLENVRSPRNWKKTKEIGLKIGNFGLNMVAKIAEGVATAYLKQQLGIL